MLECVSSSVTTTSNHLYLFRATIRSNLPSSRKHGCIYRLTKCQCSQLLSTLPIHKLSNCWYLLVSRFSNGFGCFHGAEDFDQLHPHNGASEGSIWWTKELLWNAWHQAIRHGYSVPCNLEAFINAPGDCEKWLMVRVETRSRGLGFTLDNWFPKLDATYQLGLLCFFTNEENSLARFVNSWIGTWIIL